MKVLPSLICNMITKGAKEAIEEWVKKEESER